MMLVSLARTCWCSRRFRVVFWSGFTVLTIIVLLYQWVNWAGARALAQARESLVRDGESLEFNSIIHPPTPDELNFGALPVFKDFAREGKDEAGLAAEAVRKKLLALCLPSPDNSLPAGPRPEIRGGVSRGERLNLAAWADWLRKRNDPNLILPEKGGDPARDILQAMAVHEPLIKEITAGLDRPFAQWTPTLGRQEISAKWFNYTLPHIQHLTGMSSFFGLRAVAAARSGDGRKAHESVRILIRLAEATQQEPLIICTAVLNFQVEVLSQAVWEICDARSGTAEEYSVLQDEMSRLQPAAAFLLGLRCERVLIGNCILWMKDHAHDPDVRSIVSAWSSSAKAPLFLKLVPAGWYDANTARLLSLFQIYFIDPLRERDLAACVNRQMELDELLKKARAHQFGKADTLLSTFTISALLGSANRIAFSESLVLEMRGACAMEAHFQRNRGYPTRLEDLADAAGKPLTLPVDPLTRASLGYQRTGDGRYRLWTMGLDQKDDGGKPGPQGSRVTDRRYNGDWVWDYSARSVKR